MARIHSLQLVVAGESVPCMSSCHRLDPHRKVALVYGRRRGASFTTRVLYLSDLNVFGVVINLLVMLLLMMMIQPGGVFAYDADPIKDFCIADLNSTLNFNGLPCKHPSTVTASDFVFTGLRKLAGTNFTGVITTRVFAGTNFPGFNTQGLAAVRVEYAPGGLVAPHEHPRASEVFFVVKGANVSVGFVDTNGTLWPVTLQAGDLFVFPRAMVHFALNAGTEEAISYSVLNSQNPGVESIPPTLFMSNPAISNEILAQSFNITVREIKKIRKALNP